MKRISTVLFLIIGINSLVTGQTRGLRLIEKDKFSTVERRLSKDILKEPNDIGLNYEMAVLLIQRGYAKYNPESAYMFLMKTMNLYESTTDPKKIRALDKIPINKALFQNYNDTICRHAFEDANTENSVAGYEKFLSYYKTTPEIYKTRIIQNRDIAAFIEASQKNTVESYQNFIDKYPNAVQKSEAVKSRNALAFRIAKSGDKIENYKEFINKYPEATEVRESWERVYELAYAVAEQENTLQSYQKFAAEYPKSNQYITAMYRINEINFAIAEKENKAASYKKFLDENPGSKQHAIAYKLFELRQYQENKIDGDFRSLISFIQRCPNNSWKAAAIDSIMAIGIRSGEPEALKFCTDSLKGSKHNEALLLYHDLFTNDGEKQTLDLFYQNYKDTILNEVRKKDYELAELGNKLPLEMIYKPADFQIYDEYIRKAAPREKAFVALQRIISPDIAVKDWKFALNKLNTYIPCFKSKDKKIRELISLLEQNADPAIQSAALGPPVNTPEGDEYQPFITADDKSLYFIGASRKDNIGKEDIFLSKKINGAWSEPKVVPGISLSGSHNPQFTLTSDETKMVLSRSGRLFYTEKTGDGWGAMIPFPDVINSGGWQGDAMLSPDGRTLIFASTHDGGYNTSTDNTLRHGDSQIPSDIYVSTLNDKYEWSRPINLGSVINTPYCDRMPVLLADMKTLYFSSDGHGGLGKLDLFKTTRLSDTCWTRWSEPVNLGKEINTEESERNYRISSDGARAYYSKRNSLQEREQIYTVNLPKSMRPEAVFTLTGKLTDKANSPVAAEIRWEDLETGRALGRARSDPADGSFLITLPLGKIYGYYVSKEQYFPVSNNIDLRNNNKVAKNEDKLIQLSIKQMGEEGIAVPLNNLFFSPSESTILPNSYPELKRIAALIKTNNLKVEVSGHTDNVGEDQTNQILSEKRASAVKTYLVSEGCYSDMITFAGYGKTKPLVPNDTEEGRARNRRVEIRILK